ncbi:MAG: hypothetical protein ACK52I_16630 [Pseudomonadota bacterium]|jgi:hypothetical protein
MTGAKHMTLDDLLDAFKRTVERQPFSGKLGYDARLAGIRAVVEALRDEMRQECYSSEVDYFLKEILASDGVEGTHGSPELDEDARKLEAMGQDAGPTVQDLFPEVFVPAAAPVCEWTGWATRFPMAGCNLSATYVHRDYRGGDMCPLCGKSIKFKEDSE